jgi:hypothetical protein
VVRGKREERVKREEREEREESGIRWSRGRGRERRTGRRVLVRRESVIEEDARQSVCENYPCMHVCLYIMHAVLLIHTRMLPIGRLMQDIHEMCVCTYVCVYVHRCIHIHIRIHIHTHAHTHSHPSPGDRGCLACEFNYTHT